jgi:hypothetical protein
MTKHLATHVRMIARVSLFGLFGFIGLLLSPSAASAETVTLACDPSAGAAPADWTGAPWRRPLKIRVNVDGNEIELLDGDGVQLANTLQALNLASLAGYGFDIVMNENVINWGIVRMWGFSGYIDRRTWQVHIMWVNPQGATPNAHDRQFHGTCRQT